MLKTTLCWTMHLNTDKRRFENAFYKMIRYENHPLSLESGAYYRGKVNSESSFFLERSVNSDSIYNGYERLDGEIIEDANGLLLKLTLHPFIHPFPYYAKAVIASLLLCYFIGALTFVYDGTWKVFILGIGVMFLPVFFGVLWLMKMIRRVTDLGVKARFDDLLNDIQKETERGGHIPVY